MAEDGGAQLTVLCQAGQISVDSAFDPWREGEVCIDGRIERDLPITA